MLSGIEHEFGAERLIAEQILARSLGVGAVDEQVDLAVGDLEEAEIFERSAPGGEDPAPLCVACVTNLDRDDRSGARRTEMDALSLYGFERRLQDRGKAPFVGRAASGTAAAQ